MLGFSLPNSLSSSPDAPTTTSSYNLLDNYRIIINRTVHNPSDLMAKTWIWDLPVAENDTLVGILSARDLIRMGALRDRPRFLR